MVTLIEKIRFHIIIVNYNNWADTCECLTALFASDYSLYTVTVVDNASLNDSRAQLVMWANTFALSISGFKFKIITEEELYKVTYSFDADSLSFVWSAKNMGFACGNNIVLRKLVQQEEVCDDQFVWLLNPDVYVEPTTLSAVYTHIRDKGQYCKKTILGIQTYAYNNKSQLLHIGGAHLVRPIGIIRFVITPAKLRDLDYINGGCLITSLSAFQELGTLPEEYFLYWEETDLCMAARKAGFTFESIGTTRVYDKIGSSIGRGYLAEYYYTRNALIFAHKHYPIWIGTTLLFNLVRILKRSLQFKWANALAILRASFDFVLGRRSKW